MFRTEIVVIAVVATASSVCAEPSQDVDAALRVGGASPVAGPHVMISVGGASRVARSWIWIHALVASGPSGDDKGQGNASQARVGAEVHPCLAGGWVCGSVGVDAGWQYGKYRLNYSMLDETSNALVAVPRITLDAGGARLRGLLGFEVDDAIVQHRTYDRSSMQAPETTHGWIGGDLVAGVTYQW